jgi:hypothetical protein
VRSDLIAAPVGDWSQELRPEDLRWIDSNLISPEDPTLSEETILLIDLHNFTQQTALFLFELERKDVRPTVVAVGDAEQIEQARPQLTGWDLTYLSQPPGFDRDAALQYTYHQLAAVYQPFTRLGIHFAPRDTADEQTRASQPTNLIDPDDVVAALLGEHADEVKPVVPEIDSAYDKPPFEFDQEQSDQLLALINRTDTEERRGDD